MSGNQPTCATCRFFDNSRHSSEQYGDCRRYAPRPNTGSGNAFNAEWPPVTADDWCGEHQEKPWILGAPSTGGQR